MPRFRGSLCALVFLCLVSSTQAQQRRYVQQPGYTYAPQPYYQPGYQPQPGFAPQPYVVARPVFLPAPEPYVPPVAVSLSDKAAEALRRAVLAYHMKATRGGGVPDSGSANRLRLAHDGTTDLGTAYLAAYEATKEPFFKDVAHDVALALVAGQLKSGGWNHAIELDANRRAEQSYRVDGARAGSANETALDDGMTTSALRVLMQVDRLFEYHSQQVHEASLYGLDHLVAAQYPNGAWPRRFSGPSDPEHYKAAEAAIPDAITDTDPKRDDRADATLAGGVLADVVETLLDAHVMYKDEKYLSAAKRGGEFLVRAKLPAPVVGWAPRYDERMQPVWGRDGAPPALDTRETEQAIVLLLNLARVTGDKALLEPIQPALDTLKAARLPDGKLPKYLALRTGKPLEVGADGRINVLDSPDAATEPFRIADQTDRLAAELEAVRKIAGPTAHEVALLDLPNGGPELDAKVSRIIGGLDSDGRWSNPVDVAAFIKNVETLSAYLVAIRPEEQPSTVAAPAAR